MAGDDRYCSVTAGDLAERAMVWEFSSSDGGGPKYPELREALLTITLSSNGKINSQRLGMWVAAHKDRIIDGYRIVKYGERGGSAVWQLQAMPNSGPAGRPDPTADKARQSGMNRGTRGTRGTFLASLQKVSRNRGRMTVFAHRPKTSTVSPQVPLMV